MGSMIVALMKRIIGLVPENVNTHGNAKVLDHALEETTMRQMAGVAEMQFVLNWDL